MPTRPESRMGLTAESGFKKDVRRKDYGESYRIVSGVSPSYKTAASVPNMAKKHQRQYQQRKAAGLCTKTGCAAKAASGHTHCGQHLQRMSRDNKERYERRADQALCIYCGERPQFWGVRCLICRQRFAQHPLPLGARRALRLYREDAKKH